MTVDAWLDTFEKNWAAVVDLVGEEVARRVNVDGTRMVALGVLAKGDTGEFQAVAPAVEDGLYLVPKVIE